MRMVEQSVAWRNAGLGGVRHPPRGLDPRARAAVCFHGRFCTYNPCDKACVAGVKGLRNAVEIALFSVDAHLSKPNFLSRAPYRESLTTSARRGSDLHDRGSWSWLSTARSHQ